MDPRHAPHRTVSTAPLALQSVQEARAPRATHRSLSSCSVRLGSTPGISGKTASQVVSPFSGFCPLVMSSLGSLSLRWKGAAADWCQPEKPLVNGPSRNPGAWQWLSRRSPEQSHSSAQGQLTQDGMLPPPPHEEGLGTAADVRPRGRPGHRWPGAETTRSPSPSP